MNFIMNSNFETLSSALLINLENTPAANNSPGLRIIFSYVSKRDC